MLGDCQFLSILLASGSDDVKTWIGLTLEEDSMSGSQWLFYTPLVSGEGIETASFGGDIGGLTAVPPVGPGAEPLVRGPGAKPPRS